MESHFCPACGALLAIRSSGDVDCTTCAYRCGVADLGALVAESHSVPRRAADWLHDYRVEIGEAEDESVTLRSKGRATVAEECPKCHNPTMEFFTMQLRSADEGQTVFYECPKCGHKYSLNT